MSSNYEAYLDYLATFADTHAMAVEAERNIYPLFTDIKNLIGHYKSTVSKFANVQSELVTFIGKLNFDDKDFDFYQDLFRDLRKVDGYLQELKTKQIPASISQEVQDFISYTYASASLYNLENIEEEVLSKINFTYEVQRAKRPSGCLSVILLFIIPIVILTFLIH